MVQYQFPILKPAIAIVILISLIYANVLKAPWILDDYHNITQNPKIHIHTLNMESVQNSFYASPIHDIPYRSISYFSFALNWLWGKDDVKGYHVVNIAIHMITAIMLYLTILQLFQTPNAMGNWDKDSLYFIAFLSATLWAIHPIQTQAITYIVQRMASMAAMFYLMGIFCFLKARMTTFIASKIIFWGLCILLFLLGIGSKENAILLPISLMLMEFVFFQNLSIKKVQKKAFVFLVFIVLIIAVGGVLLFMDNGLVQIFKGYEKRPFTMLERILTQPIILLFYLSQIFYPATHRFSIVHDVTYATSLFHPWYTFFCIAMIFIIIGFALWRIRKNPVLSFAILFYFGNHMIESSIIPLEMVFEHRNYLPSFFLFIPIAMGMNLMIEKYKKKSKKIYCLLIFFVCTLTISLGISTYIRNWDWRSTKSLWQDAAQKAPHSSRPLHSLAWGYYEPLGQIDKAIELYQKALILKTDQTDSNAIIYNNLASIYYFRFNDYDKSIKYAQKALTIIPNHYSAGLILCNSLAMLGHYKNALSHLNQLFKNNTSDPKVHYLKALILMKSNQFEKAHYHFRQSIKLSPDNWQSFKDIGIYFSHMKHYERGYWFLKQAKALNNDQIEILIAIIDNRLKSGSSEQASEYIQELMDLTDIKQIETIFDDIKNDPLGLPLDLSNIKKAIAENIQNMATFYEKTADRLILQSEPGI